MNLKKLFTKKVKILNIQLLEFYPGQTDEKFGVAFTHDVDLTRGYSAMEYLASKTKSVLYSVLK